MNKSILKSFSSLPESSPEEGGEKKEGLSLYSEFDDAINTDRFPRKTFHEDISWMHIFQEKTFGYIIYSTKVLIIMKAFPQHHLIYFSFRRQSHAFNVGLRKDDTKQSVCITCKAYDSHDGLRKEIVMEGNRLKRSAKCGID